MRTASVLSVITLLALAGCYSSGNKMDRSQVERFQKGVTTRTEVESHLGPPQGVTIMPDGSREARYMYIESQSKAAAWIPYVNMFAGGSKNRTQNLIVVYDQNNVVKDYDFTDASGDTSGGAFTGSHTNWSNTSPTQSP